jgi:hypothetical protein
MPLAEFLTTANNVVKEWSKKRDPESVNHPKIVITEPTIGTKEFTDAYNWGKESFVIKTESMSFKEFFVKSKTAETQVSPSSIKRYCKANKSSQFRSFDEFRSICFSIWHVTFEINADSTNWKKANCSCPSYHKNYICKHVIGLAARLKFVTIPSVAMSNLIGAKRKRGRPALSRKALEFQPAQTPVQTPTPSVKRPAENEEDIQPPKKRRGRPRKILQ